MLVVTTREPSHIVLRGSAQGKDKKKKKRSIPIHSIHRCAAVAMATEMKGETHLGWEEMLIMSVWFQDYHGHGGEQRASGRQTLCVNVSCTPLIHNWDIVIIYISCLKTHLNNLKAHNPNLTSEQKCHKMLVKTSTDIKLLSNGIAATLHSYHEKTWVSSRWSTTLSLHDDLT